MVDTKLGHVAEVPVEVGLPAKFPLRIKEDLFARRHQRSLAKSVGLTQFGVNHVLLHPGAISALRHWHEGEDEFVYVLEGTVTLEDDNGKHVLAAGAFAGFPAGDANGHHFVNESQAPAVLLVIGSRRRGHDTVHYPDDPLGPFKR